MIDYLCDSKYNTMNRKILSFYFALITIFPTLCMGEEFELHGWSMREVSPMECAEAVGSESEDIYVVSSSPLSDTEFLTRVYDYRDSTIVSDYGLLSTFLKSGDDTLCLLSVQNRILRLSPVVNSAPVFLRGLSLPQRMEFGAYAEVLGKDSLAIRMETGVVPKGRATLVIDNDTLTSLSVVDRYVSAHMPDSLPESGVWRRETRDWYDGERTFPLAREITDLFILGADTVFSPTVTLLSSRDTLEDAVERAVVRRSAPGMVAGGRFTLEAEIVAPDELLVSFAAFEHEAVVEIMVHDILGRQLAAPRKADASPAVSQIRVRLSSPMPGVFFVSLVSASGTETVKIMQ